MVFKRTKTILENKADLCGSDENVPGCEIQVNYLNTYTWVFLYLGVIMHSNKHAVLWMCNHWENSTAAFTSLCEAPDVLQIWKALVYQIFRIWFCKWSVFGNLMVFSESPDAVWQTVKLVAHQKIQFSDALKYTCKLFAKYSRKYRSIR